MLLLLVLAVVGHAVAVAVAVVVLWPAVLATWVGWRVIGWLPVRVSVAAGRAHVQPPRPLGLLHEAVD